MNVNMIFGAAYYEEYQPEDRLQKDMELMAEADINTIRIAESTWSVEEPRQGEFDFSHVHRVIEAAAAHGIDVIVGMPTYAIPPWLAQLDPEILGGNPYGRRQIFDITNPTYLQHAKQIIRELVKATVQYPNVIGYQLDNETKHYGIKTPRVIEGFRTWLKGKFDTPEQLNRAFGLYHWSNSVSSFEELPDPTGAVNASYACAFEEYRRELAAKFLKWQSGVVSSLKRGDQFVTHNFDQDWHFTDDSKHQDGYSCGLQPDMNWYDAHPAVSVFGTDVYCPCADALTGKEIAFAGDLARPIKKAPYLVLESQTQAFTGFLPYPGQLRLMALSHLASGASGLMYWPWASIHNGIESYWKGILSHDGEPGETYEEIKSIGGMLRRLSPRLIGMRKERDIAMVVSTEALHALRYFPTGKDLTYNDIVYDFYTALYELNLECDILYDRETDWSCYKLLIFPQLYCASDEMIARVREYVAEGGAVLASFRSFFADENLKIYHDRQPHGLTDVFGMHYSRFTRDTENGWMELLEPDRAAVAGRYRHQYWGGVAAATRNRYGKGQAWYLGTQLAGDDLKDFLLHLCETLEIVPPNFRWPIVCRRAIGEDGSGLWFLLNFSKESTKLRCPVNGVELLSGVAFGAGQVISLTDWDGVVLREN